MRPSRRLSLLCALLLTTSPVLAQLPDQELAVEEVASGLLFPLAVTYGPGDPNRLFIAQQDGRIRVLEHGVLQSAPFLDIRARVFAFGSAGLLGVVFHPDYGNNGYLYLTYSDLAGDTVIARYERDPLDPNRADPNSEQIVLFVPQPASIHNGGGMAFGPDGYLYIALGDGGIQGDPFGYAQDLGVVLGKILRVDVDNPVGGQLYGIPPTNPFIGVPGALEEIWAYGVRNPYRMTIDAATGDLWFGDVNERGHEEVDFQPGTSVGGENYGWNIVEGPDCYNPQSGCSTAGLTMPIFDYPHVYIGLTTRCAVIGGLVYRGNEMATLQGRYFFGDQCSNEVISIAQSGGAMDNIDVHLKLPAVGGQPCSNVSWGEDHEGVLYAVCHQTGVVYRIVPSGMRLRLPDLQAGFAAQVEVEGCTPGGSVYLAFSTSGLGKQFIAALGVNVDLFGAKLAASGAANGSGEFTVNATVPSAFLGRTLWMQALESGSKSNVYQELVD
jgi:glucose/arabinose dehydrogenase